MRSLDVVEILRAGKTVERYREAGDSMFPILKSNQPATLKPIGDRELKVGDIVFCKANATDYTYRSKPNTITSLGSGAAF